MGKWIKIFPLAQYLLSFRTELRLGPYSDQVEPSAPYRTVQMQSVRIRRGMRIVQGHNCVLDCVLDCVPAMSQKKGEV
jgi:hypothetical protein